MDVLTHEGVFPRQVTDTQCDDEAQAMNSQVNQSCRQISQGACSIASTSYSLEELSSVEFFSRQCSEIDDLASKLVDGSSIREAIMNELMEGPVAVTVADPSQEDVPMIAVSSKFEALTGYLSGEILGKNCSFLRQGCADNKIEMCRLRRAIDTGDGFTSVFLNRRKSGEHFLNLMDLRGLNVAHNPSTGEELWFLIGIHADVTGDYPMSVMDMRREDLAAISVLPSLHTVAEDIREKLAGQLSALAVSGALRSKFVVASDDVNENTWWLLPKPYWRGLPEELVEEVLPPGLVDTDVLRGALPLRDCRKEEYTAAAAAKEGSADGEADGEALTLQASPKCAYALAAAGFVLVLANVLLYDRRCAHKGLLSWRLR